uniref:ATP synthase subunit a n=1 Tax=Calotes versicolor TaxID=48253 RepID=A6P399_CALVC|nr:ATP synthase F0 subunit 6 [Calotes versicolor]BAF69009.1 ATPase subunit 6 [Calotes versicolor]
MMLNLFDQFITPQLLSISLLPIILLWPIMIFQMNTNKLKNDRFTALMILLMKKTTKTLMPPTTIKAHVWATILTTLLLFLTALNTTGILPYTFTPTTQLSMNMALAIPLWLATVIIGMRNHTTRSVAHLLPEGTPTPLIPILVLIETASLLIRPVALGVRLTANLTAGHLLLHLISTATITTAHTLPMVSAFTAILLALLTALEMAVALIQAYVFSLLVSLYLQENT